MPSVDLDSPEHAICSQALASAKRELALVRGAAQRSEDRWEFDARRSLDLEARVKVLRTALEAIVTTICSPDCGCCNMNAETAKKALRPTEAQRGEKT